MDTADVNKTPDGSAMDIVSMAFSNVSENSDLMEVVIAGQSTAEASDSHNAAADTVHNLHGVHYENTEEGNQNVDAPHQMDQVQDHSDHIAIPLPPNAIITVNEQGEQIIQLTQVVGNDTDPDNMPDQTCSIEHVEQIEQVETVIPTPDDNQPGPAGDVVPISVGGDGLEAMAYQGSDVGMVGDEACVVPVTISLTDVQNLQQVVGGVHVGPGGESVQVSSADIAVTSSTPAGLSASASSLFGSLASIIDSSSVLTNANMSSNAALSATGVTFVGSAGIPIQAVPNVGNSAEAQPQGLGISQGVTSADNLGNHSSSSTNTNSITSPAQFIHNGTNLQRLNFKNGNLMPQKKQFISTTDTTTSIGARSVISTGQLGNLPPLQKQSAANFIGNRSVFSPMTLTIRTPPGAPAVNQALINSIVNNAEVQALLKRNPGQPITIVRVPEDPSDRRQHIPGVVTAKVVTSSKVVTSRSPGGSIPRRHPGRPRKEPITTDDGQSNFPVRRRGRRPGTQIQRKEEEDYIPPVSWQPVKSRTRSGRISKPPGYRTENFKTSFSMERAHTPSSDVEGGSDAEAEFSGRAAVTYTGRVKNFKCRSCSKAYIGRGGLARHFQFEPSHGNIEDYDTSEGSLQKPEHSTSEDVRKTPDEMADSEVNDKAAEEKITSPKSPTKVVDEQPDSSKVIDLDCDEQVTDKAIGEPAEQPPLEPAPRARRGRQPNARKKDPDFQPGVSSMDKPKTNVKSMDKRKVTMQQALKFLNLDDYMDVCLPRLARHLSLWEFLVTKAELLKEDTPQVLKVLQLFEELVSDVREMAVNCLEKVEDEDEDAGSLFLDEDDDLARVLEFDKGWYKVSEPPSGAADVPFSVSSLLKRTSDVITKDEITDDATPIKIRKVQSQDQDMTNKPAQDQTSSQLKPLPKPGPLPDPQSITVHVHDGKVTTEQGSPSITTIRAPQAHRENVPSVSSSDPEMGSTTDTINEQRTGQILDSDETPLDTPLASNQPSNSVTQADPQQQTLAPLAQKQQSLNPLDSAEPPAAAAEESPIVKEQCADESGPQEIGQSSETQSSVDAVAPHTEVTSTQDTPGVGPTEQLVQAWDGVGQPEPSSAGTQFVHAAEELASIAGSADIRVEPPDPAPQQETSVVVPEGSTIMQMQDGTFLVQRPDGTAMQIHTPEGMSIETVQELLSMEAGQG